MKKIMIIAAILLSVGGFSSLSFADETVTIIVTGQSHASLYPCSCPKSPQGGVVRRATVIEDIRKGKNNVLLLEAGGSFAGGNFDQNSQTSDLDKVRTDKYMNFLSQMNYDAMLVSSEEFNFGEQFFGQMRSKYKLRYLSANLKSDFLPFVVQKVGALDVAVVGISDQRATTKSGLEYSAAETALAATMKELKKDKNIDLVVVLAYVGHDESVKLIKQIPGIDIWVSSDNPFRPALTEKIDSTTLVVPAWEARSLTKITVARKEDGVIAVSAEAIALSKNISDNEKVRLMIPACFTDATCAKQGFIGQCLKPGTKEAECHYKEMKPISVTVIAPKVCKTCDAASALAKLQQALGHSSVETITDDDPRAQKLIDTLHLKVLPAFLIDGAVQDETLKSALGRIATKVDAYYVVNANFSGVSYFTNRERVPQRLDVFFDIMTKDMVATLGVLQQLKDKHAEIDIALHFLAIEDPKEGFLAKGGKYEIEEYLRCACIGNKYPDKLWPYLSCRLGNVETSWWDDCALTNGIDPLTIKTCAQSEEGKTLLRQRIQLTQELEVVFGPTFVIDNQEIFSSNGVPNLEELEGLFKE